MKKKSRDIKDKALMALQGIVSVLKIPKYGLLALGFAIFFAFLIHFFIQIGFYGPLFASQLPLVDKLGLFGLMGGNLLTSFVTSLEGVLLLVVAILQGIAFSVMVFSVRRNKKFEAGTVGSGGVAMFAAVLGLGCVPCGTSLIMPIVTLFFSTSAYAAAGTASTILLIIALALSLFSLYKLGYVAYVHLNTGGKDEKK